MIFEQAAEFDSVDDDAWGTFIEFGVFGAGQVKKKVIAKKKLRAFRAVSRRLDMARKKLRVGFRRKFSGRALRRTPVAELQAQPHVLFFHPAPRARRPDWRAHRRSQTKISAVAALWRAAGCARGGGEGACPWGRSAVPHTHGADVPLTVVLKFHVWC